jgi:hypothetical protein
MLHVCVCACMLCVSFYLCVFVCVRARTRACVCVCFVCQLLHPVYGLLIRLSLSLPLHHILFHLSHAAGGVSSTAERSGVALVYQRICTKTCVHLRGQPLGVKLVQHHDCCPKTSYCLQDKLLSEGLTAEQSEAEPMLGWPLVAGNGMVCVCVYVCVCACTMCVCFAHSFSLRMNGLN